MLAHSEKSVYREKLDQCGGSSKRYFVWEDGLGICLQINVSENIRLLFTTSFTNNVKFLYPKNLNQDFLD